ncbi:MAG: S8 family serine peptidase, partial [Chloroflexota bacterium]|nr:S8 family serine peptidase [Chloroflexota bacterium]
MTNTKVGWVSTLVAIVMMLSLVVQATPASATTSSARTLPPLAQVLREIRSQVIVRFASDVGSSQATSVVASTGGTVRKSLAFHNTRLASYATASAAAIALSTLNKDPRVVHAFYNQRLTLPKKPSASGLVNSLRKRQIGHLGKQMPATTASREAAASPAAADEPLAGNQWHLQRIGYDLAGAPLPHAPTVAVIDTGIDYRHPDLNSSVLPCPAVLGGYCDLVGYDNVPLDENGHGTHVAGTIASPSDGAGALGVSPTSKLLPVRILDEQGYTDTMTLLQGLDYTRSAKALIPDLRVANLSLGGYFLA